MGSKGEIAANPTSLRNIKISAQVVSVRRRSKSFHIWKRGKKKKDEKQNRKISRKVEMMTTVLVLVDNYREQWSEGRVVAFQVCGCSIFPKTLGDVAGGKREVGTVAEPCRVLKIDTKKEAQGLPQSDFLCPASEFFC